MLLFLSFQITCFKAFLARLHFFLTKREIFKHVASYSSRLYCTYKHQITLFSKRPFLESPQDQGGLNKESVMKLFFWKKFVFFAFFSFPLFLALITYNHLSPRKSCSSTRIIILGLAIFLYFFLKKAMLIKVERKHLIDLLFLFTKK